MNLLNILMKRNIKIEKVMADASTIHGEKICKKLLNMDYIRDTSHKSKIYCVDGKKLIVNLDKLKRIQYEIKIYIKIWSEKYEHRNRYR